MSIRYTLILVLVAIALVTFAFLQRDATPVDFAQGTATTTPVALVEIKPEDVQEVLVSSAEGKYTLTRVAGGWEIDGKKANEAVDAVVSGIATPRILRELPADRDPNVYGFDTPTLTVTLKTTGGASHVIEIGDDTPVDPDVYIRLQDGERIVTVSRTDITALKDWRTTQPLAPTDTPGTPGSATGTPGVDAVGTPDAGATGTSTPSGPPPAGTPETDATATEATS